jgi:hypothetical protein
MGFHRCAKPLNTDPVYVHGNKPLLSTTSSGDITVTVPGTTGEKPRVWTFPDALLHYAVDVGYMPRDITERCV